MCDRAPMDLGAGRRPRQRELCSTEPAHKRICKRLETVPQEIRTCYPLSTYAVDFWDMEQELNQKDPTELFSPQNTRKKPNSMILPDNETRTTAQPCPRCIAGEPGHFSHITGL